MKRNSIKELISLFLLVSTLASITAFKTKNNCLIVVGIASKDFKCKKGDDAVSFPSHVGYQALYQNNDDNYYNTANYVKALLREKYNVPDKNIIMYSSDKATCVVISYHQKIKGWQCTVAKCAIGFGENKDEALTDAIAQKNEAVGTKVPYLEMNTFSCPE